MKIIALPDTHGRNDKLTPYAQAIHDADWIVLAGDLSNGSMSEATRVVDTVKQHNTNILSIPGNMDTNTIVDYTEQEGMNIHRQHRVIENIAFVGVGGALPFAGSFVYDEAGLASLLDEAVADVPDDVPQILVCHQPPINTRNDLLPNGVHVGSQSVRAYIEQHQPILCFTGHIHEAIAIDTIGKTQIINPGPVWKGYAYAEVIGGEVVTLEIRK